MHGLTSVCTNSCQRNDYEGHFHSKPLCEWDEETSPFRFYNIEVEATDYAGNIGQATATAIILEQGYKDDFRRFGDEFDSTTFFIDFTRVNPPQNVIRTKELLWDTSLPISLPSGSSTTPTSTTMAETQILTTASVSSTMEVAGFAAAESEEDILAIVETLEETIRETVAEGLGPQQNLSGVTIMSIGGQRMDQRVHTRHRHLEGEGVPTTSVEFIVTVLDECTGNCTNVGSVILDQVKNQVTTAVNMESFTQTLQKVAAENNVETLLDATIEAAVVSDDVSTTTESQFNIALSSQVVLNGMNMSSLGEDTMNALLAALTGALENIGCSIISASSCTVNLVSLNGQLLGNSSSSRRHLRLLQTNSAAVFVYDVLIEVSCDTPCLDIEGIADSLNGAVMSAIEAAIQSGELISSLQQVAEIAHILDNVIMAFDTSTSTLGTTSPSIHFFPDFEGKSVTCLNTANPPTHMIGDQKWFHNSLEECCEEHFPQVYHICAGSTVGFYPDWSAGTAIKCSNDDGSIPIYMERSSGTFQHETIEDCCNHFYHWDMDGCIVQSGGKLATLAQNEWYVNWEKSICQQNCLKGTGETQYGAAGVSEFCGEEGYSYMYICTSFLISTLLTISTVS